MKPQTDPDSRAEILRQLKTISSSKQFRPAITIFIQSLPLNCNEDWLKWRVAVVAISSGTERWDCRGNPQTVANVHLIGWTLVIGAPTYSHREEGIKVLLDGG